MQNLVTIISFIMVFFAIVFIHEFGHFSVAKLFGVRVNEFFIGFGPTLLKKQWGETLYSIKLFPLGGAVAMEGEDSESNDPRSISNKPAWQQFLVVLAGPIMNFVLAILIFAIFSVSMGFLGTRISELSPDGAGAKAGLQVGDRILKIENNEIKEWSDIVNSLAKSDGSVITVIVERSGKTIDIKLIPKLLESENRYIIGLKCIEKGVAAGLGNSLKTTGAITKQIFEFIPKLFYDKEAQAGVSGPIGIYRVVEQSAKDGVGQTLYLTAFISINLGVMNLLPLPALDGGRLVFLFIQMVSGKKLKPSVEETIHKIGFIALLALTFVIIVKDIIAPVAIH